MRILFVLVSVVGFYALLNPMSSYATQVGIFGDKPDQIWDRLYGQFYVRTGWDGKQYGRDGLDPLLWPETTHLLSGQSHREALGLLDEFLSTHAEKLITDPLKRAVFQRDLWAIFDWLCNAEVAQKPGSKALQERLAAVLQHVALSTDRIRSLPDTYAQAVASKAFPAQYDPAARDRAFLPPDMFQPAGPWVCVGRIGGLLTPSHFGFFGPRSVFLVFLRLPRGREATLAYLKQLRDFPQPTVLNHEQFHEVLRNVGTAGPYVPNPALPQFPAGTEVALFRQMILINSEGQLVPTHLTESVQIRVFREVPSRAVWKSGSFDAFQDVFEFRLTRPRLFAGEAGGLRSVTREEREFPQFMTLPFDLLEKPEGGSRPLRQFQAPVLESCGHCHDAPGIHSLLTYSRGAWPVSEDGSYLPRLYESSPADEEQATIEWGRSQENWRHLNELWYQTGAAENSSRSTNPR